MDKLIVCIVDVSILQNEKTFKTEYSKATPYRREKIDKIKFFEDKVLSLGAEITLRECLNEFGEDLSDFDFVENGKPVLKNSSVSFNLSHSGNYVMCAVSNCEVGCDIQQIKDIDLKIAKRFFYNAEYESIISQPTFDSQINMFFRLWTLKESFMKVTGKGFALPLNEFQIDLKGKSPTVNQSLNKNKYCFAELDAPDGYKASVCVCDDKINPQIIDIKIV